MAFDPEAYGGSLADQQQQRVDAAYQEMQKQEQAAVVAVQREVDLMTEARTRFAKAALYEQIIEGELFQSDDPISLEVEQEFKTFAEERLRILLGMETEKAASRLEEDEVAVLKLFAAKLMGRSAAIPRPAAVEAPKLAAPRPPVAVPGPVVPAQLAPPKRGRGRPPGTGKNQRAQAEAMAAALAQRQAMQKAVQELNARNRQVSVPDPVATVKQVAAAAATAKTGQIVPSAGEPRPLPMPSPDEMVAQAAEVGESTYKAQLHKMRNPPE